MAQCRFGQGKARHLQTDKAVLPCVQRRIGSGSNVTMGWLGEVHEPVTAIRWCGTLCCSAGNRSGTAGLRILLLPDERSGQGRHRGPSLIAAKDQWPRRSFLHQLQSRSFQGLPSHEQSCFASPPRAGGYASHTDGRCVADGPRAGPQSPQVRSERARGPAPAPALLPMDPRARRHHA